MDNLSFFSVKCHYFSKSFVFTIFFLALYSKQKRNKTRPTKPVYDRSVLNNDDDLPFLHIEAHSYVVNTWVLFKVEYSKGDKSLFYLNLLKARV